jgi:NDP-4-keto-2,6-dideoxyhexose 3-C-methyltransferase
MARNKQTTVRETMYKKITSCRNCHSHRLEEVLSLGDQWVTDFPDPGHEKDGILSPLTLVLCGHCSYLQLEHTVRRPDIYGRDTYWYKSGINESMRKALKDVVENACKIVSLNKGDIIIDIGSNDGTLASFYPDYVRKVGFEPSINVWKESFNNVGWWKSYNSYFSSRAYKAKVITSCAMFYDLENPHTFLENIVKSLAADGIWIDQQNNLGKMVTNLTFDNVSHEHLGYYSFTVFKNLVEKHELEVIGVELNSVNGGSFRTYTKLRKNRSLVAPGQENISQIIKAEEELGLSKPEAYSGFSRRAEALKEKLGGFIKAEKAKGKSVYAYGASTRGLVILQYCGLDSTLIDGAAERNPDKYGKVMVGVGIPIFDEEYVRAQKPDYMLVLPYSFRDLFIEREQEYLQNGGALIFPLPEVEIVTKDGCSKI